ncbi:MAG: hypothetical protein ABS58_18125 [Mesorhizobium sp. SCN 65-20]|nr:MAG: hypothetical protein ABS58_18125 [Mesorhizobium sp. SCN 65-20]
MTHGSNRQLLLTWLALVALTGASVAAVRYAGGTAGLALVLSFALFKARLVVLDFMGLREQAAMRRALVGWCALLAVSAAAKAVLATALGG